MAAQWTGDVVGKMHIHRITKKQLASALGVTPEYVSSVLHGHVEPKGAEEKFNKALDSLITGKT